ncbi:hypothetical protein MBH78_12785 [Oceanimonas sp. NS1]|nr:hypothetical protein [Oceanimonas sp. NS1]
MAQLEKSLELRLFHRTTHSLTLTEDGHELYKRTEPWLSSWKIRFGAAKTRKSSLTAA